MNNNSNLAFQLMMSLVRAGQVLSLQSSLSVCCNCQAASSCALYKAIYHTAVMLHIVAALAEPRECAAGTRLRHVLSQEQCCCAQRFA